MVNEQLLLEMLTTAALIAAFSSFVVLSYTNVPMLIPDEEVSIYFKSNTKSIKSFSIHIDPKNTLDQFLLDSNASTSDIEQFNGLYNSYLDSILKFNETRGNTIVPSTKSNLASIKVPYLSRERRSINIKTESFSDLTTAANKICKANFDSKPLSCLLKILKAAKTPKLENIGPVVRSKLKEYLVNKTLKKQYVFSLGLLLKLDSKNQEFISKEILNELSNFSNDLALNDANPITTNISNISTILESQNTIILDNIQDIQKLDIKFNKLTSYLRPIMVKSLVLGIERLVKALSTLTFPGLEHASIESIERIRKKELVVSFYDIVESNLDNYFLVYPKYCGFKQCIQFTSEHNYLGSDDYSNIYSEEKCTKVFVKKEQNSYICTEPEVLECLFFPENITDCEYTLFENKVSDNFELYNKKRLIGSVEKNEYFFNIMLEKEQVYLLSTKLDSTFALNGINYSLEANIRLLYHYQAVPFALTKEQIDTLTPPTASFDWSKYYTHTYANSAFIALTSVMLSSLCIIFAVHRYREKKCEKVDLKVRYNKVNRDDDLKSKIEEIK